MFKPPTAWFLNAQKSSDKCRMVHLVRQVVYQRVQCAAMLACAKVFEAMRQLYGAIEVPDDVLAAIVSFAILSNLLAQLVDEVRKTFCAVNLRYTSIIHRPSRR